MSAAAPQGGQPGVDAAQLLEQLRDIHMAPEPAFWPPAPGWWVVAALLLVALFFAARILTRRLAEHRRRRKWQARLDEIDQQFDPAKHPAEWLGEVNALVKIIALRAFPSAGVRRLHGNQWTEFLSTHGLPAAADSGRISTLTAGKYAPVPDFDADADREVLRAFANDWILRYG